MLALIKWSSLQNPKKLSWYREWTIVRHKNAALYARSEEIVMAIEQHVRSNNMALYARSKEVTMIW